MNILSLKCRLTNCYLIESCSGWIMVDTDWPDTLPQLLHLLRQQDIQVSDIKYLIVTHFHPDHAGIVENLKDLGINLILHESQVAFTDRLNEFFSKNRKYNYKDISQKDNIVVSSAESRTLFKSAGLDGELIRTPGHSDDSISLIIDNCCAFTGDLPSYSLIEAYDNPVFKNSWINIQSYNVETIYPAHRNPYNL